MNESTTLSYTRTAVFLHWLIGLGILCMFALGWYMTGLPKEGPKLTTFDMFNLGIYSWQSAEPVSLRNLYFNLHKSIGITLLALIVLRIVWRLTHEPPSLLASLKVWEKKLANLGHRLLYVLMIAVPLSGLIMTLNGKYGVKWFGIPLLPASENKPVREVFLNMHEIVGIILLVVIVVHVLGALKHHFIDKDGSLQRML